MSSTDTELPRLLGYLMQGKTIHVSGPIPTLIYSQLA